ncbi:MAG: ParB/RepB/Spo0J family partition protein [Pyrinomonadaceae bacterium]
MNQELREVPINQIDIEDNYRKTFNEKSISELAQSIRKNGVIQPVVLRTKGDRYVLVAGERRLRASKLADKVTIPSVIRELSDAVDIIELQLIENIQKEGVSYMEEAYGIQKLRDKGSLDAKEIAARIGKSEAYVYFALRLTTMSPAARDLCEKGWIGKGAAYEISKLKDEDHQTQAANALARTQKEKQITASGAKHYIADNFGDSAAALKKQRISQVMQDDHQYALNWKHHLVRFSMEQFDAFKKIVRGRTENMVLSEAVDAVMRDTGTKVAVGG